MDRETFRQEVEEALAHLRDVVRLRTMDLATLLLPEIPRGQRGWELSRYLLERLTRLKPSYVDADDWVHRRYEVLSLRYVNGHTPDQVADRLAISRRHFYRLLDRALDDFAGFLWGEVGDQVQSTGEGATLSAEALEADEGEVELLRREAAALVHSMPNSSLAEVLHDTLDVLSRLLRARSISVDVDVPTGLPEVSVNPVILKQFLLAVLGGLLDWEPTRVISLSAEASHEKLVLLVTVQGHWEDGAEPEGVALETIGLRAKERAGARLAVTYGASLDVVETSPTALTYQITLPVVGPRVVLVVDDNEEVCLLFRRYLTSAGFRALAASSGAEAIALARSQELYAVTLDLMMSDEDGWDVLQSLTHDPQTSHVPIIVCTVLDHEDLALSLGACGFLKKPVMREDLLMTLAGLPPPPR